MDGAVFVKVNGEFFVLIGISIDDSGFATV
jgi:hypothetical protein